MTTTGTNGRDDTVMTPNARSARSLPMAALLAVTLSVVAGVPALTTGAVRQHASGRGDRRRHLRARVQPDDGHEGHIPGDLPPGDLDEHPRGGPRRVDLHALRLSLPDHLVAGRPLQLLLLCTRAERGVPEPQVRAQGRHPDHAPEYWLLREVQGRSASHPSPGTRASGSCPPVTSGSPCRPASGTRRPRLA